MELLVVLGILGLMFAAAFMAIGDARERANDRHIQEQLQLLKLEAEKSFEDNMRSYNGVFDTGSKPREMLSDLGSADMRYIDGRDGYAVSVLMSDGTFYCVANTGQPVITSSHTIGASGDCELGNGIDCTCN